MFPLLFNRSVCNISVTFVVIFLVKNKLYKQIIKSLLNISQIPCNWKGVDGIKNLSGNNKDARVKEVMYKIVSFRRKLHEIITRLNKDGIILDTEKDELYRSLLCVEEYITNKNDAVRQEVDRMGDEEYMTFTQRAFAEGEESGFRKAADKFEEEIKKLREENERLKALQS